MSRCRVARASFACVGMALLVGCSRARSPRHALTEGRDPYETRAIASAGGAVERHGDSLRIHGSGSAYALVVDDTTDSGTGYRVLRYDGRIAGSPFHGVGLSFHEGAGYLLVHDRTARQTRVDKRPVASPSGRWLAVPSFDLEAQFDPNALSILRVDGDTTPVAWRIEPTRWGPDAITWRGDDTLLVVQRWVTDSGPGQYERREALVLRRDGAWVLDPPDTAAAAEGP